MKPMMFFVLAVSFGMIIQPMNSYAVSKEECAIWICLPTGFPNGCSGAHKAFHKRIRRGDSALPRWSSCKATPEIQGGGSYGNSNMSHKWKDAAYIRRHKVCNRWEAYYESTFKLTEYQKRRAWFRYGYGYGDGREAEICTSPQIIPAHYIKDTRCIINRRQNTRTPEFCVRTDKYLDMFLDGEKFYKTTYYNPRTNRPIPNIKDDTEFSLDLQQVKEELPEDTDQQELDLYIQSLENEL